MAPDSRPPLSHQRPPLATRLRKSFESKRSKSEATSPSFSSYAVQDPEALQTAVEQAINSEAFQNAIAANLARLIKPSITTALDTIQPIVEAVYSHDVLLRRTNKSVEDILERMDTAPEEILNDRRTHSPPSPHTPHSTRERSASAGSFHDLEFRALIEKSNKRTVATLAELSNAVSGNNSKIAGMEKSLVETKESVEYLKAYLHNQLDQVQADMGRIVDTMEANRNSREAKSRDDPLLLSHTSKLDGISADVASLKSLSTATKKLDSMSSELNALRASFDASTSAHDGHFVELGSKLTHFGTAFDAHGTALQNIQQSDKNADILAALQTSNASHESHATVLNDIKERSLAQPTTSRDPDAGGDSGLAAALQELKPELASIKDDLKTGLNSNNENVADLHAKIESILTSLEEQKPTYPSAEILESVQKSNDSHASHASALDEIKSLVVVPAPSSHIDSLKNLESQIGSIIATLELHGVSLADLKAVNKSSTDLIKAEDSSEAALSPTLESHTMLLNEIKDNISAEILTALHEIGQTQAGHTASLSEIREADVSDEILTALHTSIEAHTSHESAFKRLHEAIQDSNDMHEKHGVALGDIKARSLEPGAGPSSESAGLGDLETRLGSIHNTLEEQSTVLAALKDSTNSAVEYHKGHIASLNEIKDVTVASKELHESHGNALSEIQAVTLASKENSNAHTVTLADLVIATGASNESHAAHAATLSELKSLPSAASTSENPALGTLETHLNAITDTLSSHTNLLTDIKATNANSDVLATVKSSHDLLTSHTTILDSIKSKTSNEDVIGRLSSLHSAVDETKAGVDAHTSLTRDLHSETKDSHSSLATTISALAVGGVVGGGAGMMASKNGDDDDNIEKLLGEVQAVKNIVEKSSLSTDAVEQRVTSIATQIDINHTTITTSITSLGDELKAEVDASSTEVVDHLSKLDRELKDTNSLVGGIDGKVEVLTGGVQLSENGLKQLSSLGPVVSVKEVGEHDSASETSGKHETATEPLPRGLDEVKRPDLDLLETVHQTQPADEPTLIAEKSPDLKSEPALTEVDAPLSQPVHNLPAEQVEDEDLTTKAKSAIESDAHVAPDAEPEIEEKEEDIKEVASPADSAIKEDVHSEIVPPKTAHEAVADPETATEQADKDAHSLPKAETIDEDEAIHSSKVELDPEEQLPAETKPEAKAGSTSEVADVPDSPEPATSKLAEPADLDNEQTKDLDETKEEPAVASKAVADIPSPAVADTPAIDEDVQEPPLTPAKDVVSDVAFPSLDADDAAVPVPAPAPELRPSTATAEALKSPALTEATDEDDADTPSALTSPVSPGFTDGETSTSKKGKKGKNGKGGNKKPKTKKEKVPFVLDGEEPEDA